MPHLSENYPREFDDARRNTYFSYDHRECSNSYVSKFYSCDAGSVFWLWSIPLILSAFGVVAISSMMGWSLGSVGMKQALWLVISLCGFIVVTQIPLKVWFRCSMPLLILSFVFMLLTVYSPLRVTVKGASRWIRLGPISFQPLEFVSLAMMLELSKVYLRERSIWRAIGLSLILLIPFFLVIMKQPDFGGLLMLAGIMGALFVESYGILLPLLLGVCISPLLLWLGTRGYRAGRIQTWLNPWADPMGAGYQVIQGLIAFANGRIWGVAGMHGGTRFLPEVHNDFIFAALGEQFGIVGTASVFLLFFFWTLCVWNSYKKALPERRILVWGCCVTVLLTFFINLGGIMKIIPLTGMPLPFISYGGTSLLFMWVRIGLLIRLLREPAEE